MPPPLAYPSAAVGHFFWRTGWDADARSLTWLAGPLKEAHAGYDAGSFLLWGKRRWLIGTANTWSRDGIRQQPEYHSLLRFEKDGRIILPKRGGTQPLAVTWSATEGKSVECYADNTPFYAAVPGLSWSRRLTFDGTTLQVADDCTLPDDVTAHFQLQLSEEPVVIFDPMSPMNGQVMTDSLLIESVGPEPVTWAVHDWRTTTTPTTFSQGWRLTASGAKQFKIRVSLR